MSIHVECSECGEERTVPDTAAGRRFRCKGCGEPVSVPRRKSRASRQRDEFDDDDDDDAYDDDGYDEPSPRRRSSGGGARQSKSKSGGGFRWGPLVALAGIPLLFIGFFVGHVLAPGSAYPAILGLVLMNIAFGVSSALSAAQKGHSPAVGIPLAFIGLLGLLVVAFLPDNSSASAKKGKKKRRR